MKNVNITHPGGDGNPGRRAKQGTKQSEHICLHMRSKARKERAYARGADKPQ